MGNCQEIDRSIGLYGIQGETIFDNSQDSQHQLDITCDFGEEANLLQIYQVYPNGTEEKVVEENEKKLSKALKSPERNNEAMDDSDNLSFIKCTAEIEGRLMMDQKQIRFYDFVEYGEEKRYPLSANSHDKSKWSANGEPQNERDCDSETSESDSLVKRWEESPGVKQKVEARDSANTTLVSWDVIVCGFSSKQSSILGLSCLALLFSCIFFIGIGRFNVTIKKKVQSEKKSKIAELKDKIMKWKNQLENHRWLKYQKVVLAKKMSKFLKNLPILNLLLGLGFYYRGDIWWAGLTFGVVLVCWLAKLCCFFVIIYYRKKANECEDIYKTLRGMGMAKLCMLAFFHQAEQLLSDDLDEDPVFQ